jgi:hypothetical protein
MNNKTGSILEFKGKKAIVMTCTCDFITIKRLPEMFIGQQIKLTKSDFYSKHSNYLKHVAVACMLVLILSSVLFFQIFRPETVFAYVDIDINPSLELVINKNSRVIDFEVLNNDAQTLVKNLKLKGIPLKNALRIIIEESGKQGFISPHKENAVLVAASIKPTKDRKISEVREKSLDELVSELSSENINIGDINVKPELIKVSPGNRAEAIKNNISMGRYALFEKLSQINNDITLEKARNARVSDMLSSAGSQQKENSETGSDKKASQDTNSENISPANSSGITNKGQNPDKFIRNDAHTNNYKEEDNGNTAAKKSSGNSRQHKNTYKNSENQSDKKDSIEGSSDSDRNDSPDKPKSNGNANNSPDKKETSDQGSNSVKDNPVENKQTGSQSKDNSNADNGNHTNNNGNSGGKGKNSK